MITQSIHLFAKYEPKKTRGDGLCNEASSPIVNQEELSMHSHKVQ
jgi:hypothetical protein